MKLTELNNYVENLDNLTKIEATVELNEFGNFYVMKTKETYVYEDEDLADNKVDYARQHSGFAGVEKKFKQGKMNKAGEIVKPETWTVVVKLNH